MAYTQHDNDSTRDGHDDDGVNTHDNSQQRGWVVLQFDQETMRGDEDTWISVLQEMMASVTMMQGKEGVKKEMGSGRERYLVVCPPLAEDEHSLRKMMAEAAREGSTINGASASANSAAVELLIGQCVKGEDVKSGSNSSGGGYTEHFVEWMCAVVQRHHAGVSVLREDAALQGTLQKLFTSVYQQLLGIALLGEVSARTTARVLAVASEIVAHMAVALLNKRQGVPTAAFLDSRDFLPSVSDFFRADPTGQCQDSGSTLLSSSGLERVLERKHSEHYLEAYCDTPFRDPELMEHLETLGTRIVITQGSVARDMDTGNTTILGLGGSDSTVAYLAAKIGAKRVDIWTHTHGLFTCQLPNTSGDPFPTARVLKSITYHEALEIAANNSSILSPTCIKVLQDNRIPMHVRSMRLRGKSVGTFVSCRDRSSGLNDVPTVKCICLRKNITLISVESLDMWRSVGFLADVFSVFKRHGISICHVATSETNVTCTLDTSSDDIDVRTMESLVRGLQELNCHVETRGPCAGVSLVGHGIRAALHKLGPVMKFFEEHQIHLLTQASTDVNLTFLVDESQSAALVQKLHDWLFGSAVADETIGRQWEEIVHDRAEEVNHVNNPSLWWRRKRDRLLELAGEETPLYVYDEETLVNNANRMMQLVTEHKVLDGVFYAMKANSNPHVLRVFESLGLGFECVSISEVERVLSLFPDIDRKRVLFTPNFAPKWEYERGFELGINVTLDNTYPLRHWEGVFRDREIFCRIDPGQGLGHHRKVQTAGTSSKFGIPPPELDDLATRCARVNCRVVGLHAHVGSGILTKPHAWRDTAQFLWQVMLKFPHVTTLDLGGGLGVPQKPGDVPLDLQAICDSLSMFKQSHPGVKLVMEPGRFLVATAGVLLARVTQTKSKGDKVYVGIDTGMNSMMRPALYNAYHEIVNLSRIEEECEIVADICGPICESGDMLGFNRHIQQCVDGDVILLATAGAYGFCMSNDYNLRKRGQEILLRADGEVVQH